MSDHAALQLEALYSRQGIFVGSYRYQLQTCARWRYRATLAYLDVPAVVKLHAGAAGTGFFQGLGLQLSVARSQREYLAPFGASGGASNPPEQAVSPDRGALVPASLSYVGERWLPIRQRLRPGLALPRRRLPRLAR